MARPRILIIEDERALTRVLCYNLEREGYEVVVAHDGLEGLRRAQTQPVDVIILDLMLPTLNGLDVCRELRASERTRDIPIVMLTAKAEETDQIVGFSLGADDYVTKPFSVKVLLQRIKALRRRLDGVQETGEIIEHLGVRIDRIRHRASVENKELELTPTEFRLLECLLRQPGRAFTRAQLMDAAIAGQSSWMNSFTVRFRMVSIPAPPMDERGATAVPSSGDEAAQRLLGVGRDMSVGEVRRDGAARRFRGADVEGPEQEAQVVEIRRGRPLGQARQLHRQRVGDRGLERRDAEKVDPGSRAPHPLNRLHDPTPGEVAGV